MINDADTNANANAVAVAVAVAEIEGTPMTSAPSDEPPEHARYAEYLQALRQVAPADEGRLVRAVLTDPDRTMARSAVLRHLDHRAAALHRTPAYEPWSRSMLQATTDDPFLTTRLHEWTSHRPLPPLGPHRPDGGLELAPPRADRDPGHPDARPRLPGRARPHEEDPEGSGEARPAGTGRGSRPSRTTTGGPCLL